MASVRKVGDWNAARRILAAAPRRFRQAVDRAVQKEAHLYRKELVQGLTSGSPGGKALAPLAETTLATRRARGMRGTKPLIARGDLRRSMVFLDALTLNKPEIFIGNCGQRIDAQSGQITDAPTREFLQKQLVAFAAFIAAHGARRS